MRRLLLVGAALLVPVQLLAQDAAITRRDGFLMVWKAINRPALETRKASFEDIKAGESGATELIYAKSRGILNEESAFFPTESLRLGDALVWLFRSRNVSDNPDDVSFETLGTYLAKYPIAMTPDETRAKEPVTQEQLKRMMTMLDQELAKEVHEVSLYAEKWHGQGTAFGEPFDMHALTAAHRSFPHNTLVRVTNQRNGKSVVVRINDRGPFVHGRDMDLSLAAFTSIEDRSKGLLSATFERLGDSSVVSADAPTVKPSVSLAKATTPTVTTCATASTPIYQRRIGSAVRLDPGIPRTFVLGNTMSVRSNKGFTVFTIQQPNGKISRPQEWIAKDGSFSFTPELEGIYKLQLKSAEGKVAVMTMRVVGCKS